MILKKYLLKGLIVMIFLGNIVSIKSEFDIKSFSTHSYEHCKNFVINNKKAFSIIACVALIGGMIGGIAYLDKKSEMQKQEACRDFVVKFFEANGIDTTDDKKINELVKVTLNLLTLYKCDGHPKSHIFFDTIVVLYTAYKNGITASKRREMSRSLANDFFLKQNIKAVDEEKIEEFVDAMLELFDQYSCKGYYV